MNYRLVTNFEFIFTGSIFMKIRQSQKCSPFVYLFVCLLVFVVYTTG